MKKLGEKMENFDMGELGDERNLIQMGELGDEKTPIRMGELGETAANDEDTMDSEHLLVLKTPIQIADNKVPRLEFDFESLTAKDLSKASKYLKNLGIPVSVPALDYDYQMVIFTYAVRKRMSDVEMADLMRLSASDAMKATGLARDFLLGKDPGLKDLGSEE